MSHAAKSIFVFGIYVLAAGLTLMLAPNLVLALAGLPATNEVWIWNRRSIGSDLDRFSITHISESSPTVRLL